MNERFTLWTMAIAVSATCLSSCEPPPPAPELDEPLLGLTEEQLERFEAGEEIFEGTFTAEQGVGPLFNNTGCAECHSDPVDGANGDFIELHGSGVGEEGACESLLALGGPVFQLRATQALTDATGLTEEPVPAEATSRGQRSTPDVFGFGLLDAIPDETLLLLEDPDDRDGDGISGRANRLRDGRIGRFGRKAGVSNLADFNEGAFLFELGITTPRLPQENTIAGAPLPEGVDPAADPEISAEDVALTTDYVRFLAPPAPAPLTAEARRGQHLFAKVGCADCHVPSLRTGKHEVKPLSKVLVHAYTDLLVHDLGPENADLCAGEVQASEFRTEPLMGLRHVKNLLHDGRAKTIEDAIQAHGGEGERSRSNFQALRADERAALLAFLGTL